MTFIEKAALAEKAARAAGEMLEHHSAFKVMRKSENDFVTEMDFKSEALIKDILLNACPEDQFFGEETGGSTKSKGRWIVDPIDGTSNFMHGHRIYTISIAYEHDGELVVGCVFCPGTDELFLAVRGEGATLNGKPIHVSEVNVMRNAILEMAFGHRDPENLRRTLKILPALAESVSDLRRLGSCAYDLCCVADGRSDGYVELGLKIYDYAAGYVILREAGGVFSGWTPDEDALATGNIVASNGLLHAGLMTLVKD